MILFRRILTQVIRNGNLKVYHILNAPENEILQLSPVLLRKVVHEFYLKYEKSDKFEQSSNLILSRVNDLFQEMATSSQMELIKLICTGKDKGAKVGNEIVLKALKALFNTNGHLHEGHINLLARVLEIANESGIPYDSDLKDYLDRVDWNMIENFSTDILTQLCNLLEKRARINKYFITLHNNTSIFSLLESQILKKLQNFELKSLTLQLKCFVSNDQGSEDFIRSLEQKIFSNIEKINESDLITLQSLYKYRYIHNLTYIHNSIQKPLYNEFTSRFNSIKPLTKSLFLFNSWFSSWQHGIYTDDTLPQKLQEFIENMENFRGLDEKTRNFLILNVISYLSYTRNLNRIHSGIIDKVYELIGHDPNIYLKVLHFLVKEDNILDDLIWKYWERARGIKICDETSAQLYSVYLNFKYRLEWGLERFLENLPEGENFENMQEKWKKSRIDDLGKSRGSKMQRELEVELSKKGIKYISEFYDDYFIDIVIPDQKIAIEVSGPGHYLFPSHNLNSRTYNKQQILRKKGWQVYNLPFFSTQSASSFLFSTLPINS